MDRRKFVAALCGVGPLWTVGLFAKNQGKGKGKGRDKDKQKDGDGSAGPASHYFRAEDHNVVLRYYNGPRWFVALRLLGAGGDQEEFRCQNAAVSLYVPNDLDSGSAVPKAACSGYVAFNVSETYFPPARLLLQSAETISPSPDPLLCASLRFRTSEVCTPVPQTFVPVRFRARAPGSCSKQPSRRPTRCGLASRSSLNFDRVEYVSGERPERDNTSRTKAPRSVICKYYLVDISLLI
jgi:hypothetical protein